MNVISFDLSLNSTGYSVFNHRGKLLSIGTISTDKIKDTPLKLKFIANEVNKLSKKYKPKVIVIERGFSRFNTVTQQLFRVHGLINYLFYKQEQVYITSKSVRKLICGYGNIKKNDFFLYVKENNKKIHFNNNDEVDSFALGKAYFIQKKHRGEND